jgi:hypothetical protein
MTFNDRQVKLSNNLGMPEQMLAKGGSNYIQMTLGVTLQAIRHKGLARCDLAEKIRGPRRKGTPEIGGRYLSEEATRHHPTGLSPVVVVGA